MMILVWVVLALVALSIITSCILTSIVSYLLSDTIERKVGDEAERGVALMLHQSSPTALDSCLGGARKAYLEHAYSGFHGDGTDHGYLILPPADAALVLEHLRIDPHWEADARLPPERWPSPPQPTPSAERFESGRYNFAAIDAASGEVWVYFLRT